MNSYKSVRFEDITFSSDMRRLNPAQAFSSESEDIEENLNHELPRFVWVNDHLCFGKEGYTLAFLESCNSNNQLQLVLFSFLSDGSFDVKQAEKFFIPFIENMSEKSTVSHQQSCNESVYSRLLLDHHQLPHLTPIKDLCCGPTITSDLFLQSFQSFIESYSVDNCGCLPLCGPAFILFNLRLRYFSQPHPCIYTYAGSVLLCVNPYGQRNLEVETINAIENFSSGSSRELPPHPFSIAELAFRNLAETRARQTIIISGDSGAGKTETAKIVIRYLASRHFTQHTSKDFQDTLYRRVEEMNPILESFGNAATTRNWNSSRFGRLNTLYFKDTQLISAGVVTYLLERSRITHLNCGERNFHVFYYLIQSGDTSLLSDLGLLETLQSLTILCDSPSPSFFFNLESKDSSDVKNDVSSPVETITHLQLERMYSFDELKASLLCHGFIKQEIDNIWSILAAILHLGNLSFLPLLSSEVLTSNVSSLHSARLLGISIDSFISLVCSRRLWVLNETTPRPESTRLPLVHTIMRWLYSQLFSQVIVKRLNEPCHSRSHHIAILDIFGFEALQTNSFEQFLINLANEKLQYFFVNHLILAEQYKFIDEKIQWKPIPAHTGVNVLRCITGSSSSLPCVEIKKEVGIFRSLECPAILPFLDDVGRLATASTESTQRHPEYHQLLFWSKLQTLKDIHKDVFCISRQSSGNHMCFLIRHFADDVVYNVQGWIQKNNDKIDLDVFQCLSESSNELVRSIAEDCRILYLKKSQGRFQPIAQRFVSELDNLLDDLSTTHLSFIRCFLPNRERKERLFHGACVLRQMQQSGTLQLLKVFRRSYSFYQTYVLLHPPLLKFLQAIVFETHPQVLHTLKLLDHPKLLTEIFLLCFAPTKRRHWELGVTMLFARSTLGENLNILTSQCVSAKESSKLLDLFQWQNPSVSLFTGIYKHIAQRPWRTILRPMAFFVIFLRQVRALRLMKRVMFIPYKWSFSIWTRSKVSYPSILPVQCLNKKKTECKQLLAGTQQYTSPWFATWKHQLFSLSDQFQSLLFFDGDHLWLVSSGIIRRAERLFLFRYTQYGENKENKLIWLLQQTAELQSVLPCSIRYIHEETILGVCRHQSFLKLFCVVTQGWFILIFNLAITPGANGFDLRSLNVSESDVFLKREHYALDMKPVLMKLVSESAWVDSDSLKFLKAFFPDATSETLVGSIWIFRSRDSPSPLQNQFLILIIDVCHYGDVKGFFYGRLPSLTHIHKSAHLVGSQHWTSTFPRYMNLCIRPSFFSLLEYSVCIVFPSNRGFLWSGCGFLMLFGWYGVSSFCAKIFNIQLVWESQTVIRPCHMQPDETPSRVPQEIWYYWISRVVTLKSPLSASSISPSKKSTRPSGEKTMTTIMQTAESPETLPELVLLKTFQGWSILLTLSSPNRFLSLDKIEYHTTSKPCYTPLYVDTLSIHPEHLMVLQVSSHALVQRFMVQQNPFTYILSHENISLSMENFSLKHPRTYVKLTCVNCHWNGKTFLCSLADLVSGCIQTWSIDPAFKRPPHFLFSATVKYPQHLQHRY